MPNLEIASIVIWFLAGAGTMMTLYYATKTPRGWWNAVRVAAHTSTGRAQGVALSLDTHIATQWTDGRLRLDTLLRLIKTLGASLEQEVAKLRRGDRSDPAHERAPDMVGPTLRRFTFDQHLRNECRVLVPLLEFCGKDLAESQGLNTTQQLAALAEIEAAMKAVDGG